MLSALFRKHAAPAPPAPPSGSPAPPDTEGSPDTAGSSDTTGSPDTTGCQVVDGAAVIHARPTDPAGWVAEHRDTLLDLVAEHGALTVRGLGPRTPADVEALLHRLADRPAIEREAFAARDVHAEGVYSSSVWPPNQPMCMHHELSYATRCPGLLLFACLRPPTEGGATAVADSAAVLRTLPAELTDRFEREGWLLTRTYHDEIGATLTQSFGTEDRGAVEAYCRAGDIDWSWQPDGSLRTRQHRPAVVRHPVSGVRCWFNQIAFLNEWTMAPEVREFLVEEYGPDGLPFNTRYGNGDPVPRSAVEQINKAYEAHTVRRPWTAGDLMVVDNIRTAHSREAYEGPREVLVAMGNPVHPHSARPEHSAPRSGRAAV
ncbi:TauD/TfdA family dioxygenase [Streptomyces sp. BB1-1-1]|uniref:TauD/TfdA family dioxygenase n=1 Tax=Streptomyces sp. BB1-1-1 TaxID=3074430 RepID=UPI0028776543|nr:TauD/TfdA family dioxygenase [Streptomyces sp. BB1-1-1]WND33171.1 TauD/TfdA family dioxygenase [Streptomyces sp. BB1-1-1]